MSKTIALFRKADSGFPPLACDVLVPIQDHLGGKGRVAADLDGDVTPLGIEYRKGLMVHIRHRLLTLDVMLAANVPDRRLGASHQNQKQSLSDRRF